MPRTTAATDERGFSDPAFGANKTRPIHRWVPWIAGFSASFVQDALQRHLTGQSTVLDPFAGVGTTLVEAILSGHDAIGFEINPYAALASRTKLYAARIDVEALSHHVRLMEDFCHQRFSSNYSPRSLAPSGFKTRSPFYSPAVLRKVLIMQDFVDSVEAKDTQSLFRLAFASTMVCYSNYSYEPSLSRRVAAGKGEIRDFPVLQTVLRKLNEMAEDITWLKSVSRRPVPASKVVGDSFLNFAQHLSRSSVSLVITSPPYLNNYHYNRNTRPQLYWLGYASTPADLHPLEMANFGKFWQTVRELPRVDLSFSLMDSDLGERLDALRGLNAHMGIYGGGGWANYAASYFNDCHKFAEGLRYALKPGGTALVVIGNSILHGIDIPTDRYLAQIAESCGLELVEIHIPRATRVGNSIIQSEVRVAKAQGSRRLYEAVVELRQVRAPSGG